MSLPKVIAVIGPTATGKSALAISLAQEFNGELISCDSRQQYIGLDIGSNKDRSYPQHLMDMVTPEQRFTVADFQREAQKVIAQIVKRGKVPILVGGTGLYVWAVLANYNIGTDLPEGTAGKPATGESLYDYLLLMPSFDRQILYDKINARVDEMIKQGLVSEVRALLAKYGASPHALTGIGYKQIIAHLQGQVSLEQAILDIKKATRQYAKRQITWWRHHGQVNVVQNKDEAVNLVRNFLGVNI